MNRLQELRKRTGYSQSELSKITGISTKHIQGIEGGRKDLNKLAGDAVYRLTLALRCDIEDIIDTEPLKQETFQGLADFLADIEMSESSHDDYIKDYSTPLEFYLSNAEGDGYLTYLTDNWVDTEEDAIKIQELVIERITVLNNIET
ncbi:helix-turn-helix transcriptional regulator [Faecalicatena contorta]|uniref:DNA-binding transcriptional regulator, XRE-family HTH domain n=1 Tax=Faecalicatena contorta TaxID=39482 RepID=A0A315ZV33_9FIRM|nr:helix-turn-helix transcriptional regulator [Faecalicatena contorta]PWJ49365.1 DNA-binding XRE family transcriptional regulator [Faecalicatena contorta]SUQ14609.1 DNA-binding transcriptional regulator, XRE-family HTH domain [Faecalicatena contorta]